MAHRFMPLEASEQMYLISLIAQVLFARMPNTVLESWISNIRPCARVGCTCHIDTKEILESLRPLIKATTRVDRKYHPLHGGN